MMHEIASRTVFKKYSEADFSTRSSFYVPRRRLKHKQRSQMKRRGNNKPVGGMKKKERDRREGGRIERSERKERGREER